MSPSPVSQTFSWTAGLLFVVIGILNIALVHPVPGIFYLLLSLIYFPPLSVWCKQKFGLWLPWQIRVVLAFSVLWGTLAVGDLTELLGL